MSQHSTFGTRLAERLIRHADVATTSQAIAFDAIDQLTGPSALAWQRLFLRHSSLFALGAEAPATDFRDYKNHMLFPRDGYWGGAPAKAQSWYLNLVAALQRSEWQNVAYCAGVLSFYVSAPLHPFQTAQSEAENDIHAALDLTVWTTYPALARRGAAELAGTTVRLAEGPEFLAAAMASAAEVSNRQYETLLAHYKMARALGDATAGLDDCGQRVMGSVIARSVALVAAVLSRAISEAGAVAPVVPLKGAGLQALLGWPVATMAQRRRHRIDLRAIAAMSDELSVTGHVDTTLPETVRVKRDLYGKEIAAQTQRAGVDNIFPLEMRRNASPVPTAAVVPGVRSGADIVDLKHARRVGEPPRPAPHFVAAPPIRRRADIIRQIMDEVQGDAAMAAMSVVESPMAANAAPGAAHVSRGADASDRALADNGAAAVGHAAAAVIAPSLAEGLSNFRDRRREASRTIG